MISKPPKKNNGIALIMALWLIAIFMVMVIGIMVQSTAASRNKNYQGSLALAQAGAEAARGWITQQASKSNFAASADTSSLAGATALTFQDGTPVTFAANGGVLVKG